MADILKPCPLSPRLTSCPSMTGQDEDFASMLDASFGAQTRPQKLSVGDAVEGVIVQISSDMIFIDIGRRSEAELDRHEVSDKDGNLTVELGDKLRATVARPGEPVKLVMSLSRSTRVDTSSLEMARDAGVAVEGEVTKVVKAGVEVQLAGVRAFCPASQVDRVYTEDLSIFEGQTLKFRVMEVRDNGRSVIVSRRALLEAERAEQAEARLADLSEGAVVEGTVVTIKNFGAFVDIGGVEGMVHISELGEGRVSSVHDVVSVGEQVQVRVLAVETPASEGARPRIKLSMRTSAPSGGGKARGRGRPGKILEGTVTGVENYGVFIQTEMGQGMIPNRELDLPPGGDPRRTFPVGMEVRVAHLGKDPQDRLRFSIKQVGEIEARAEYEKFQSAAGASARKGMGSLGDLLQSRLGGLDLPASGGAAPADGAASPSPGTRHTVKK